MATTTHPPQLVESPPNGATSRRPAERLAPLTGVAVMLLGVAGLIVLEGPADRPEFSAPRREILRYFGEQDTVVLGSFLLMLAAVFFIWFAGWLRAELQRAEGATGRLSATAFGGALITGAFMLAMPAANALGAVYVDELSPVGAQTFFLFGNVFLYPAAMAGAVLTAATALVVLRTGAWPRWLGWLSLVLAIWLLVPPLGAAAGTPEEPAAWTAFAALSTIPIWTAVTAVALAVTGRDG
jgi:hypothetical protein